MTLQGAAMKTKSAFTLIELLIVVGIIAILAAIAIPNMLEAQIRAKVARVKSDLRTVTTALETYRVDSNAYCTYHYVANSKSYNGYSFHVGGVVNGLFQSPPFDGSNPLTTPVAYLSAMPGDVFGQRGEADGLEGDEYYYVNWEYALARVSMSQGFADLRDVQGPWRLHSPGPDRTGPDSIPGGVHISYDPTNGTVSLGDVIRTQKEGQR